MNTTVCENGTAARSEAGQFLAPFASISETAEGYTLHVEMPGVNKEALDISIEGNELTITGRRSFPAINGTSLHRESRREDFRRTFEIDPSIDQNRITAKIEQGVVTLALPKSEEVKPRKISVA